MVEMKVKSSVLAGIMVLAIGTACGAALAAGDAAPAAMSPDILLADERIQRTKEQVRLCQEQLRTAHKQVEAARALLKAAESDYKAARSDKEALLLKQKAESIASDAGLQPARVMPGAERPARSVAMVEPEKNGKPEGGDLSATRIQQVDFAADPESAPARMPLR